MPAITYTLLLNNAPAPSFVLDAVQEIEVEEHSHLADMLRLKLAIGVRENGSGWHILDDNIFERLSTITLIAAIGTDLPTPLITAHVIETKVGFSNRPGESVLEVVAMDSMALMNLEQKIRSWENMADSDIVTVILAEYGFVPIVDSTNITYSENQLIIFQHGTDMQLVRYLAERSGYEFYLETTPIFSIEGHFHPPKVDASRQKTLTVNMGSATNVSSFNATFQMLKPTQAKSANLALESQEEQSADVSSVSLTELGRESFLNGSQQRQVLVTQTGLADTAELQNYAQAVVDSSAWALVANGELDTSSYGEILRAKRPVLVRGVGEKLSGAYYVEKVQHLIAQDSYTQHFQLKRNAIGLTGLEVF